MLPWGKALRATRTVSSGMEGIARGGIDMGALLSLDQTSALLISIVANSRLVCTFGNLATVSIHTQGPNLS